MKMTIKSGGSLGHTIFFLLACGFFLWTLSSRPEASQLEQERSYLAGATDILVLNTPKSIDSVTSTWNPTRALGELSAIVLKDRVKRILGQFPSRLGRAKRDKLAQMLIDEGNRAGIDPLFLAAVIRIESAFHPGAVSNKGARGLMQVMPATGREVARWIGMDWTGPDQLHDPETNVKLGVHYLQWLLNLYSGNYQYALTAYNRGPYNLSCIVRRHGSLKSEFTEYFDNIQKAYRKYRRSLTRSGFAILAAS